MIELGLDVIKSFSPKKGIAMRYFRKILIDAEAELMKILNRQIYASIRKDSRKQKIKKLFKL